MAKTYKVKLGGVERELKYTANERELLEDRFGIGLADLIRTRIAPVGEDGKPTGGGLYRPSNALVWAGLKHNGPKMTERHVDELIQKHQEAGGSPFEIYSAAISAVLSSGVLGYTVKEEDVEAGDDEGKENSEGSAMS